jgi:hypothetical protein
MVKDLAKELALWQIPVPEKVESTLFQGDVRAGRRRALPIGSYRTKVRRVS